MELILILALFLIIAGQSFVLLLLLFRIRQKIRNLTDEIQRLTNEEGNLKHSLAELQNRLNESDRKSEEDRKALKMIMISDLHNDIEALDKRGDLDEKLRILLGRVKENISKTEDVQKKSSQ
jgi:DNA repair exonuclease SbcCD ATPase subunit